jgi:hypothetical protein
MPFQAKIKIEVADVVRQMAAEVVRQKATKELVRVVLVLRR